ncbi:MAG: acetate uptake transporter [Veillonellaceae bacterium]|nr:acetate uptake transporter [Veillonellaceae bacterium]
MSELTAKHVTVSETVADPTPLGLFGLAMVCFVASSQKLGWTAGTSLVIPWAILLGSFAQLIASYFDFKHNNAFGSVVFGAYGLFWSAMGVVWLTLSGAFGPELAQAVDTNQLGFAFIGYLIFSAFGTVAALETNKAVFSIMVLINFLFIGLALDTFGLGGGWAHDMAAWSEFVISLLGFYASGGLLVNRVVGRTVFPLGGPFGILKK